MQVCRLCKEEKPLSEFRVRTDSNKHRTDCNYCRKIYFKTFNGERKQKQKDYFKNYYQEHKEEIKSSVKEYRLENKESIREYKRKYQTHRRNTDPIFAMKARLRHRLKESLKYRYWKKSTKFNEYIGCSNEEFKAHIESLFTAGMSWDNRSEWHLDHIMPLDFAKSEDELYELCHFLNIQPLWIKDNCSKNNEVTNEGYAALAKIREFKRHYSSKIQNN